MNISFSQPLSLGWRRMKMMLFQPFDLGRWFVLGFTAWLAQLGSGADGGSSSSGYRIQEHIDAESLAEFGSESWHWFTDSVDNAVGAMLIGFLFIGAIMVGVLLLWLSSRGRFMFLDNLVTSRTEVGRPWREHGTLGDSLFLWRLVYAIVTLIVSISVMAGFLLAIVPGTGLPDAVRLLLAVGLGGTGFLLIVVCLYIEYFLKFFVVPIMYKHRIGATAAWGRFLAVFRQEPAAFAIFGLFFLVVFVAFNAVYVIGGLLTCCVGLVLLAIPYLGTVLTLPITVLSQYMNLEFLAQFGPETTLLPPLPAPAGPASGNLHADGAVVRPEDVGEDPGGDQTGPQDA